MSLPVFLNKWIIGFKPIIHTSFWYWYRLICHDGMRLDDRHLSADFWYRLNLGWWTMEYDAFVTSSEADEAAMGISCPDEIPDTIYLTSEDYDAMMEKINDPDPPSPFLRQLLTRPAPWD